MTQHHQAPHHDDEELEAALAPGTQPPVGQYRFEIATERWWWSDEVYRIHGFAPGEVVPTTQLLLSHKHPEDVVRVDSVFKEAQATGAPFSSVHRIIDAAGRTRTIALTGQGRRGADGEVAELVGYVIDVTDAQRETAQRQATAAIRASAEHRAAIEQAKGILMVTFGIEPEEAFVRLREASNLSNVAVRELAERLVSWFSRPGVVQAATSDQLEAFLADPTKPPAAEDAALPA